MKQSTRIKKITICGFGLIGGSIALDLARGKHAYRIVAFDRPKVLQGVQESRAYDVNVESNFARAVSDADIVILAATHSGIKLLLSRVAKQKALTNCLVIDTGAVKQPTAELAQGLDFAEGTQFLPTHPMAGREKAGFANAARNLFWNRPWYVDESVVLTEKNQAKLDWLMTKLQTVPVLIANDVHDQMMSEVSHLPQLISTLLGAQINPELASLAGPGLRSMLRLAGSPYSVWKEVIEENRDEIMKALDNFEKNIKSLKQLIRHNEPLTNIFTEAARSYKCLS